MLICVSCKQERFVDGHCLCSDCARYGVTTDGFTKADMISFAKYTKNRPLYGNDEHLLKEWIGIYKKEKK